MPFDFTSLFSNLGDTLTKSVDYMKNNPDQMSIALDTIAKQANPDNPLAGIGSMLAKSKLANAARQEQKAENQSMISLLSKAFGLQGEGEAPSPSASLVKDGFSMGEPSEAAPKESGSLLDSLKDLNYTPGGEAGPTTMTVKAGKEGGREINLKIDDVKPKSKEKSVSLADMFSGPF